MKKNKIIKLLITIFFLLLPFLDMLRTTSFKDIEVFNISLIELINIVLIGCALILTVTKISNKRAMFLFLGISLFLFYLGFHNYNILKFNSNIYELATTNVMIETYYILRVYLLPILLLFILDSNKDVFDKEFYFKMAKCIICIISFSILILNIFKLSYRSYGENGVPILNNVFDYFLYNGDFRLLASRGFFHSANEISAILLMLLPINIYLLFKEKKKFNIVLYGSQILAMILVGTRTSAYGTLLVSICVAFAYGFLILLKRIKPDEFFSQSFLITTIVSIALLVISPFMISRLSDGTPNFSITDEEAYNSIETISNNKNNANKGSGNKNNGTGNKDKEENKEPSEEEQQYIKQVESLMNQYQNEYRISSAFLKLYPVKNDPDFWLEIMKRDKSLNNDNRIIKTDILNRIYIRNNNPNDKWLGLGYTLNFMDLERDYCYQFYLFGILGLIILIGPYFGVLAYFAIKCFKDFKNSLKLEIILSFMSVVLGLMIAYFSGHVFGWVSPMMILVFALGMLGMTINENQAVINKKGKGKKKVEV